MGGDREARGDGDAAGEGASPHDAAFLRRVVDLSAGIIFVVDPTLTVTFVSQAGIDLIGYEYDDVIGRSVLDFIDIEWNPVAIESVATALSSDGGQRQPMTFRALAKNGDTPIMRVTANVQIDDPLIGGLVVFCEVWTEQWLLEQAYTSLAAAEPEERTLELLIEVASAETLDAHAAIAYDSEGDRFASVLRSSELPPPLGGPAPDVDDDVVEAWASVLPESGEAVLDVAELPAALRTPAVGAGYRSVWMWSGDAGRDGLRAVWVIAWRDEPRLDAAETRTEMMRRLSELAALTVRRAHDDELNAHAATHDSMTGLWNRNAVFDTVTDLLSTVDGPGVGVVYLDLDRFKAVNDEYGHAAGDRVLEEIARRLRGAAPTEGRIGRFGGDEFVYAGPADDLDHVERIAAQLVADIVAPIDLRSGEVVRVGASTGAAFAEPGAINADQLVERADAELYRIKNDRGDRDRREGR